MLKMGSHLHRDFHLGKPEFGLPTQSLRIERGKRKCKLVQHHRRSFPQGSYGHKISSINVDALNKWKKTYTAAEPTGAIGSGITSEQSTSEFLSNPITAILAMAD